MLLSSCWTMQSFSLLDSSLARGKSTTAQFVVRPSSSVKTSNSKLFQFVLVGVNLPADVAIGKATWNSGKNPKFGLPSPMIVSAALAGAIGTQCDSNGLTYSTITGMTWKGFLTSGMVNDKQLVDQTVSIAVKLAVRTTATRHDSVSVIGITGAWSDDGDGILNSADSFMCTGNATTSLFVK
jgi:hypothetical protein